MLCSARQPLRGPFDHTQGDDSDQYRIRAEGGHPGLSDAVRASLKRDHGMDDRTVAECLASAMEDTGAMDVNELIGTGPSTSLRQDARKKSPLDRSRE